MKAASRKIVSYLMLCIALLPLIFALYTLTSQAAIHHQMREELEQRNLVTVHIKSSEIVWIEKGKEARIDGDMFDVKSYSIKADEIELTGLFDKNEDNLFAQIDNTQTKNDNDATGITLVLKWFSCFSWNTTQINNDILFPERKLIVSTQQSIFFQDPILSCDTPPPKFI